MKQAYLYPGKLIVSVEPTEITTILGSCVAVALFDPITKIAGLTHYLLDQPSGGDAATPRYGCVAIPMLVDLMVKEGAKRNRLQAKVFGGASVLGNVDIGKDIGSSNIDQAWSSLEQLKIPVLEQNTGGTRGRRIVLTSNNFDVHHEFMRETARVSSLDEVPVITHPGTARRVNGKIGIIDTSSALGNYFYKIFRKNGLEVVGTATDVPEAWSLVYWYRPSLLVLGVQEPAAEGVKLLKELKRYGQIPPVVVYSFGGRGVAMREALHLGVVDFVHTPSQFDPNALILISNLLIEKIRAFLDTAGERAA